MNEADALYQLLLGQDVGPALARRVSTYGHSVLETNRRFNLTGAKTPLQLLAHISDSMAIAAYTGDPHVDVGSGAGFPALPVAFVTGAEVVLIEASVKKAAFLAEILARFGLRGKVLNQRAENAARNPDLREKFASATARAVSSPPVVAELLVPFLRVGGRAILQRRRLFPGEAEALSEAAGVLGARVVPIEEERPSAGSVFILEKHRPTPDRFPRKAGIPQKRPLCWPSAGTG